MKGRDSELLVTEREVADDSLQQSVTRAMRDKSGSVDDALLIEAEFGNEFHDESLVAFA